MNSQKELELFVSRCFEDGDPRGVQILIGEKYIINGVQCRATEGTYEELLKYQDVSEKKYRVERHGKFIKMLGLKTLEK